MAYSKEVLEHYEKPRNVGSFSKCEKNVGTGLVGAPACGDVMKLQLKINDAGIIEDAKFKTFGCGSAIAASSLVTEWVKGKTLKEAEEIKNVEIVKHLSLPPLKRHCSVLAENAIKSAIADYKNKRKKAESNKEEKPKLDKQPSAIINITDAAAKRIKSLLQNRGKPSIGMRIDVTPGGCVGLTYSLDFADTQDKHEEIIEDKGVKILIPPKAIMYLLGTTMDYVDETIKSGFVFTNPNEKARCGCGKSFSI
jgi:nitrogen fixation protein NifU and related proteins